VSVARPEHPLTAARTRDAATLAGQLPPLLVEAERVAASASFGVHGRRQAGPGEDFWQFRPYGPGDSASLIDWRRSAKSGPVYVREREWQAAQSIALWCDTSSSMAYRSAKSLPTKADRAQVLGLALSLLLVDGGERIAALGQEQVGRYGAPITTRAGVWRLGQAWADQTPPPGLPVPHRPLPKHTSIVIISDFLMPLAELEAWLVGLAQGQQGTAHLIHVLDPAERDLPFSGRVRFRDLETNKTVVIKKTETIRDAYRDRLHDHITALGAMASKRGWTHVTHATDHPAHVPLIGLHTLLSGAARGSTGSGAPNARA